MGCMTGLGRFILVILNLVILLIALAVLAVGVLLKFFADIFNEYILGALPSLPASTKSDFNIPELSDVTELPFVDDIGLAFIIFGAVLCLISFFACCGACYKFRCLLILFVITMTLLVICQAVVGGLFLAKNSILHDNIKKALGDKVKEDFKEDGDDVFSASINLMNYQLRCCGIRGWSDFNTKPASCCLREIIDGDSNDPAIRTRQQKCTSDPPTAPDSDYNQQGCYVKLQDKVLTNLTVAAIILAGILLIQVLEIIFACLIAKQVSDEQSKVGPI